MIYQHIYAIIFVHVDHAFRVFMSMHKSQNALRSACGALGSASVCGTLWSSLELVWRRYNIYNIYKIYKVTKVTQFTINPQNTEYELWNLYN